jgi:hypothetical protein
MPLNTHGGVHPRRTARYVQKVQIRTLDRPGRMVVLFAVPRLKCLGWSVCHAAPSSPHSPIFNRHNIDTLLVQSFSIGRCSDFFVTHLGPNLILTTAYQYIEKWTKVPSVVPFKSIFSFGKKSIFLRFIAIYCDFLRFFSRKSN